MNLPKLYKTLNVLRLPNVCTFPPLNMTIAAWVLTRTGAGNRVSRCAFAWIPKYVGYCRTASVWQNSYCQPNRMIPILREDPSKGYCWSTGQNLAINWSIPPLTLVRRSRVRTPISTKQWAHQQPMAGQFEIKKKLDQSPVNIRPHMDTKKWTDHQ